MDSQYLSPLHIQDGFAYGWATRAGRGSVEVHLWLDGRHVATEFTGAPLPPSAQAICGSPPRPDAGFAFALPAAALDGFPHDVHAGLKDGADGLHGEVRSYQHSAVRGEVAQQGRQFVGKVWFRTKPARAVHLEVADDAGRTVLRHPLAIGSTPDSHGYPASFGIRCDELPAGQLRFSCRGQALRGSPLARRVAVLGVVEDVGPQGIRGWAFDSADIGRPLELCLRVDGRPMAWFRPNMPRPEIEAHLGQSMQQVGLLGFHLALPDGVADGDRHRIEVVSADDGQPLKDGHRLVRFDPAWVEHPRPHRPHANALAGEPRSARQPLVSLVVLNRNGENVLSDFLDSWLAHNRTVPAEIIVIDHASSDGSLALLKAWEKRLPLRTIALDKNDSFSASSNLGAGQARGEYLLFMNNDIVWLHDALPALLQSLQQPDVGIVGMKLLKAVGESEHALHPATEVQHLGVRFKLSDRGYWPYEAAPCASRTESEYAPQVVPAVTGAVLLCRKADFEQVGGFGSDYFYGFEDVEFCLRLSQRLRKLVVSRNDACALHRHGHTRLSGREISLFERVQRNSAVLESHVGLWAKQAYWRSLVQGDGYMTSEALTIGIVVDAVPAGAGDSPLAGDALALANELHAALPRARVLFLPPERGWKNAADLHLLVVGTPGYDVRSLQNARPDLLTVAWVRSQPAEWKALPWWNTFGAYVNGRSVSPAARRVKHTSSTKQSSTGLFGKLLAPRWRLRVAVNVPLTAARFEEETPLARRARQLQARLKQEGLPCWLLPLENWDSDTTMADACITLHEGPPPAWTPRSDVLNVLWLCDEEASQPAGWAPRHGCVTYQEPDRAWLERAMEQSVGSTFRPS